MEPQDTGSIEPQTRKNEEGAEHGHNAEGEEEERPNREGGRRMNLRLMRGASHPGRWNSEREQGSRAQRKVNYGHTDRKRTKR